ncbi:MAG: DUF1972 domain-containing protein, partial [Thermoanaerobaculia bacterium]
MSTMIIGGRRLPFAIIAIACLALLINRAFATPGTKVTGELVETYCWAKLQVGGPTHARCGIECAKRGIPVAVHVDGLEWKRSKWSGAGRRYYQWAERVAVRLADRLIA